MVPPPPIYTDFFWPPLTEDVEELLGRWQQTESVRYEVFSSLWRSLGLSTVFHGIHANNELKKFCRVAMATAVKYFLPPYSYQIRVGGLYLMHAFYHTQLAAPPVKLRLALKDWHHVHRFLQDSVDAQHYDVAYVLRRLLAVDAVHYAAMPHFLEFRRYLREKREPESAELLCRSARVHVQELVSRELLEEVANVQAHYEKTKAGLMKDHGHLCMARGDLPARLHGCVEELSSWQAETFSSSRGVHQSGVASDTGGGNDKTDAEESSARARHLASIKKKGYRTYRDVTAAEHVHDWRRRRQQQQQEEHHHDDDATASSSVPEKQPPKRPRRPPSLRERTFEKLGSQQKDSSLYHWLLSVPEMGKAELIQSRKTKSHHYHHLSNADDDDDDDDGGEG